MATANDILSRHGRAAMRLFYEGRSAYVAGRSRTPNRDYRPADLAIYRAGWDAAAHDAATRRTAA